MSSSTAGRAVVTAFILFAGSPGIAGALAVQADQAGRTGRPEPAVQADQGRRSTPVENASDPALESPALPASASAGADEAAAREWFGAERKWREWSRLTGDWAGFRTRLEGAGITVSGSNVSDWSSVAATGRRNQSVGRGLGEIGATLDLARIAGIPGLTAYVQLAAKRGGDGAVCSENVQGFSSIDADDFTGVGEAWFEQTLAGGRLRLKVGRVDANSEFAQVEHGGDFINPSMGYSPTILGLPTYPLAVPSLNLFVYPTERFYAGAGIYEARHTTEELSPAPDAGAFVIGEAGMRWSGGTGRLDGRVAVGTWRHTARLYRLDAQGLADGARGFFVTFDQDVWREAGDGEEDEQGIEVFGQYGTANPVVSQIDRHVGFGVTWTGMVGGRDRDKLGVGVTSVQLSRLDVAAEETGTETAYGIFYKIQLNQWLSLKPDLQYIHHGAGIQPTHRVVTATCRVEMAF